MTIRARFPNPDSLLLPGMFVNAEFAQAINTAPGGVQASIVNTGNSGSPQYRLILRSTSLAPDSIQLSANPSGGGSQDLLNTLSSGSAASYDINGLGVPIQSSSRTVTLASHMHFVAETRAA